MCVLQSVTERQRERTMLRLALLVALCSYPIRTALVADTPTFSERLDKLYEKLERLNTKHEKLDESSDTKLYEKLDRLNSLSPESDLNEEDEELLHRIQMWGMLSADQLDDVMRDLKSLKHSEDEKSASEKSADPDYDWNEEELQDFAEGDYAMDEWETEDESDTGNTHKTLTDAVTPAPIIRETRKNMISAASHIEATNERPRILDDSGLTAVERKQLQRAALQNMGMVVRAGKCLTPQPRWLTVRQLAPAADIVYMPPCVLLHRCAPDSGCCDSETDMCAPVDGRFVSIPFYLNRGDGNFTVSRMLFYNHTRCSCVSKTTLLANEHPRPQRHHLADRQATKVEVKETWKVPTEEPRLERDEEPTVATQMRRCTCPTLFLARMTDNTCSCVCDWKEYSLKRECLSLFQGREHFGLKDRVCVANGDCTVPSCKFGLYDRNKGTCPSRKYRRIRYHSRGGSA